MGAEDRSTARQSHTRWLRRRTITIVVATLANLFWLSNTMAANDAQARNFGGLVCPGNAAQERRIEVNPPRKSVVTLLPGRGRWLIDAEEVGVDASLMLQQSTGKELVSTGSVPERAARQFLIADAELSQTQFQVGLQPNRYSTRKGYVRLRLSCLDDEPKPIRLALENFSQAGMLLAAAEKEGIDPAKRKQQREDALVLLDETSRALDDLPLQAWAEHNAGFLLRRLGRMQQALPRLQRASLLWARAGNAKRSTWARYQAAMTQIALGNYADADAILPSVIASAKTFDDSNLEANARNDACLVKRYQGHFLSARSCYDHALHNISAYQEPSSFINSAVNLAQVEKLLGRPSEARASVEFACRHLPDSAAAGDRIRCRWARAMLDVDQGTIDAAIAGLNNAMAIARSNGDTWWQGTLLLNLADARRLNGEDIAAGQLLAQAAKYFGENDLPERAASTWLALSRIDGSNDKQKAAAELSHAMALYDSIANPLGSVRVRLELARVALSVGDIDSSKRYLSQAREVRLGPNEDSLPAEFALLEAEFAMATKQPAVAIGKLTPALRSLEEASPEVGFHAYRILALAHDEIGEPTIALDILDRGIDNALKLAGRVRAPMLRRWLAYEIRKLVEPYVAISLGPSPEVASSERLANAIIRIDAIRAPVWDAFGRPPWHSSDPATTTRREYLLRWIDQFAANHFLSNAAPVGTSPGLAAPHDVDAALNELDSIESQWKATAEIESLTVEKIRSIQTHLSTNSAILMYFVTPDTGYSFVLRSNEIRAKFISISQSFEAKLRAFQNETIQGAGVAAGSPSIGARIATEIWPSLEDSVRDIKIVTDSIIEDIPFAALSVAGIYISQRAAIEYMPSLRTAAREPRTPSKPRRIALLADSRAVGAQVSVLAAVHSEIESVRSAFPEAAIFEQSEGALSAGALLTAFTDGYDIVHVAGHAFGGTERPELSGIFVGGDEPDKQTQVVGWRNILSHPVNAGIVTISACEAGTGPNDRTEGSLSLARAIAYAGAGRVLAARWSVDDRATALLMAKFYSGLARGMTPSEALARAQSEMAAGRRYSEPRYWAAFFIVRGRGGETSLPPSTHSHRLTPGS